MEAKRKKKKNTPKQIQRGIYYNNFRRRILWRAQVPITAIHTTII